MNRTIIKAITATALMLPLASFAGTAESESPYGRIYGQIDLGQTYMNINKESTGSNIDKDQLSSALRLGYEFPSQSSLHLGLEAGSQYFGEFTLHKGASSLNILQGAVDLLMVVRKDINPQFSVFAKGGAATVIQQASFNNSYPSYTTYNDVRTDVRPELAGGVKYDFNRNVAVVGTVNHIFADTFNANATQLKYASTTTASLGLRVTFG